MEFILRNPYSLKSISRCLLRKSRKAEQLHTPRIARVTARWPALTDQHHVHDSPQRMVSAYVARREPWAEDIISMAPTSPTQREATGMSTRAVERLKCHLDSNPDESIGETNTHPLISCTPSLDTVSFWFFLFHDKHDRLSSSPRTHAPTTPYKEYSRAATERKM